MLVIVIATSRLIADRRFNIEIDLMPVCYIGGNTRIVIESGALPDSGGMRDANNATNSVSTDKVVATRGPKKEVGI